VDWNKVDARDPTDPTLGKGRDANTHFDVNLGLYWFTYGYYLGFSVKHLAPPKLDFENHIPTHQGWRSHSGTQFYLMSGYEIKLNHRDWSLRPEWFMRYVHHTPMAINLGTHAVFRGRYSFGANVQTGQRTVSFSARGFVTDFLRLGYSYNIYFGSIQAAQQGSHEISINYQMNDFWENREEHRVRPNIRNRNPSSRGRSTSRR
jgi:type IX secretion system PorP/SprF family membrane protein